MVSLGRYGKIIHEYEGVGSLIFNDGKDFACSIHVVQLSNGKILAQCLFQEELDLLSQYCMETPVRSVSGKMDDDEFHLSGQILLMNFKHHISEASTTVDVTIIAGEMTVRSHIEADPRLVMFGITNFEFIGNRAKEYSTHNSTRSSLDILEASFGGSKVQIHKLPDYEERIGAVAAQKGIDVTCEAELPISSFADLESLQQLVGDLCLLLSFARGTKINWIYFNCYDEKYRKLLSVHRNNITWQYSHLSVIDPMNPHDTSSFLEQTYRPFLDQKKVYWLDKAMDEYLDARRETTFLNTRALTAIVVAEFLRSRYAERKRLAKILSDKDFQMVRSEIEALLTLHLEGVRSALGTRALVEATAKISELNRTPFRSILRKMCKELKLAVEDKDLDRFVKIRNSLVHRATFTTSDVGVVWHEYTFIMGMLDKIILRMLSYDGYYLDIANGFERTKISTSQE